MGPKRDVIGGLDRSSTCARTNISPFITSRRALRGIWEKGKKLNSDVNDPKYADFYGPATLFNPFEAKDRIPTYTEFMDEMVICKCF